MNFKGRFPDPIFCNGLFAHDGAVTNQEVNCKRQKIAVKTFIVNAPVYSFIIPRRPWSHSEKSNLSTGAYSIELFLRLLYFIASGDAVCRLVRLRRSPFLM